MAPACVKLWTRCLQDLQQLPAAVNNDPAAVAVIYNKLHAELTQWRELPPLSARDWRKLVLEVKVPDVLFAVCCSVAQHGQCHGVTLASLAAFPALEGFFHKASNTGGFLFEPGTKGGVNSSITSYSANSSSNSSALSLAPGIRSQVLQSGLMGAIAAAMEAATDELAHHPPQYQPATQTSTSSSTAAAGAGHSEPFSLSEAQDQLIQYVPDLLQCWHWVCRLWPEGREQLAAIAIAAPAAVRLSAAIMQVVSRDLPSAVTAAAAAAAAAAPQSSGSEDHAGRPGAVDSAKSYADGLCGAVYGVQQTFSWLSYCIIQGMDMPELGPVLALPEFTTGLATQVVLLTQALLAQQWLGPTAAATSTPNTSSGARGAAGSSRPLPNSNSSPSTVSTASGTMSSLLNTKINRKLESVLRNLPECTKALLETLGMDSRAMVWAAAAQHKRAYSVRLIAVATALVEVFGHQWAQNQRQQQLLLLIPATLLHWASNTRIKSLKQAQGLAVIVAVPCTSLIKLLCLSFSKRSAQQHDADQCREGAALEGLEPVTPAELKEVLPDAQKVLAMLLQRPWEPQPPSLVSSDGGGIEHDAPWVLAQLQCHILQSAVGGKEHVDNWTCAAVMKMFSTVLPTQLVQPLAEFRSMTVQTLVSLEGIVRASAQQLAAGSMLDSKGHTAVSALNAALMCIQLTKPGPLLSLAAAAGPGSPEQQQLYSLLSSLLKLSALGTHSSNAAVVGSLSFSCLIAACASIKLLDSSLKLAQDSEGVNSSSNSSNSTSSTRAASGTGTSASSSSTAIQQSTGALAAAAGSSTAPLTASAVTLLPSLVLLGRCFLIWAQHLQQAVPQLLRVHAGLQRESVAVQPFEDDTWLSNLPAAPVLVLLCWQPDAQGSEPPGSRPASQGLQSVFSFVSHWLTHPAVADQLAAAGHNTQQLPQVLGELMSAHRTVTEAWASDNFTEATAMDLVQQLQVTGRALAGLAVPTMCCNPSCNNITGPSDLQLVSGRSCLCGGCRTARYCSRICQKAAWNQHKPACSALAAAAAAPGALGAAGAAHVPQVA